jgi:hypothetical protein
MCSICHRNYGDIEDNSSLLLQLPMWIHSPHGVPSSVSLFHCAADHVHRGDNDDHFVNFLTHAMSQLVLGFIPRDLLALENQSATERERREDHPIDQTTSNPLQCRE